MKEYDVIVVGAGTGLSIAFKAQAANLKVALIDRAQPGGTCVNTGCVPSKILIHHADVIADIEEARKLGIAAEVTGIDFPAMMARMKATIAESRSWMLNEIQTADGLDYYNEMAHFVGDYTLEVGGETMKGRKIFIATGSRPLIPPIKGLDGIDYLTNENLLDLSDRPESLVIIGGGYIGVEYAHFFAAMGSRVTVVQREPRLLPNEEPEISAYLKKELSKRLEILTDWETVAVGKGGPGYAVTLKDLTRGGVKTLTAASILVAAGRVSNADLLKARETGVETDPRGYIRVDDTLLTTKANIWALGDAIGRQMFTHAGEMEQRVAWLNAGNDNKTAIDFNTIPHAVFTRPQIASIGLTEEAARKSHDILIGRANYTDVVMGDAMLEKEAFAKAVVDKKTQKILGFHIIGPDAAVLIQEVANAMAGGGDVQSITGNIHIFPALSEIVPEALKNLE